MRGWRGTSRTIAALATAVGLLAAAPAAEAVTTSAFDGAQPCTALGAPDVGSFSCSGIVETWDGVTPIDANLFLPSNTPPAGGFPLIGFYHGWGGSKLGLSARTRSFLSRGYAVFSISDRGWGASCGGTDTKRITPDPTVCANGYNHLLDTRFEVRDAQYLMGLLVDDGIADPQRIGATGGSYGGGMSMSLAALKDRIMLPNGTYAAWESPGGTPVQIAAAAPEIPWTDLAYSLQPNGATLDYVADAPYRGPNADKRIGVLKQSFVAGLYALGAAGSNYAPPGTDQDADLTTWYGAVNSGEPYDTNPLSNDIVDEITTHHSSYYIDHSEAPAPLLISNGWTDDLFPPDEAIRFYNRTKTQYPSAHMKLFFLDYGHQRGRGAPGDTTQLAAAQDAWFDHFVKGTAGAPFEGVTTLPKVCSGANPSGPQISASNWAAIAPGEVRFDSAALQPISPQAGSPQAGQAFDPISGGGACASTSATDLPGAANYRLAAAPAGGFTLLGSPTVVADFYSPGLNSQIAARLLDVDSSGNETLVARGLWRPHVDTTAAPTRQVFQLHPVRWQFAAGHIAKLELLPADQPYGRNSNGQGPVTVQNLQLRLPVSELPGSAGGLVQAPAGKILPSGYALAADFAPDADVDNDGWPDDSDNCPAIANGTQLDSDGDGTGDACDLVDNDADNDGVSEPPDNCPTTYNPAQTDTDDDGTGDACDPDVDADGDGVNNDTDNCVNVSNPGQQDSDGDGIGNACDMTNNDDLDDDGVDDSVDNCPGQANPAQKDDDSDGIGNACDPLNNDDFDEDGVPNSTDNCATTVNAGQQNSDSDAQGDACDPDDDNDGVLDTADACRTQAGMGADGCPPVAGLAAPSSGSGSPASSVTTKKKCKKRKGKRRCKSRSGRVRSAG